VGFITICVGSAILFKQLAFAFVISVLTVQSDLPHVCRSFVNTILENLGKFSHTVAHAPNILAFIFLTRQICEMGMDPFHSKVTMKYSTVGAIADLLPLNRCFTTKRLPQSQLALPWYHTEQTSFPRALYTRAM
jgi:hypothetical protein